MDGRGHKVFDLGTTWKGSLVEYACQIWVSISYGSKVMAKVNFL